MEYFEHEMAWYRKILVVWVMKKLLSISLHTMLYFCAFMSYLTEKIFVSFYQCDWTEKI